MNIENAEFLISTDPERLDLNFLCRSLNATYWAQGRPHEVIRASVRNSLCFGVYQKETTEQIGFARVVTDQVTFSWVCDVLIDERYRGRGLGKWLMACVVSHPHVKNTTSLLATRDAHGLYEKFGYQRSEGMRRPRDGVGQGQAGITAPAAAHGT
jgi:GNAT superfamily N-acetyltransferase